MQIESPAFELNQYIPKRHTCEGEDLSPPLKFAELPKGTKSLVLIVDDPDAPSGTFDHWIAWNIPGDAKELKEGAKLAEEGTNGFGQKGYKGPCPPKGKPHRYFFTLYALDSELNLPSGSSKTAVKNAMNGHILGNAHTIGLYQR
jgi:Raf kinase inhibitor-like YbhB/YbcL family protein